MENTKTENKKSKYINTGLILVYLHFPFSAVTRRLRMANGLAGSPISVPLKTAKQLKHKKKIECSKRDGNTDKTRCFSSYDLTCKTAKLPQIFWKWALKQNENACFKTSRLFLKIFLLKIDLSLILGSIQ